MSSISLNQEVVIDYTNWKGVRRERVILPLRIEFGSTEYHPEMQWLLRALDMEDDEKEKWFAMKDVHGWKAKG